MVGRRDVRRLPGRRAVGIESAIGGAPVAVHAHDLGDARALESLLEQRVMRARPPGRSRFVWSCHRRVSHRVACRRSAGRCSPTIPAGGADTRSTAGDRADIHRQPAPRRHRSTNRPSLARGRPPRTRAPLVTGAPSVPRARTPAPLPVVEPCVTERSAPRARTPAGRHGRRRWKFAPQKPRPRGIGRGGHPGGHSDGTFFGLESRRHRCRGHFRPRDATRKRTPGRSVR